VDECKPLGAGGTAAAGGAGGGATAGAEDEGMTRGAGAAGGRPLG
jgi:hypothetical protein